MAKEEKDKDSILDDIYKRQVEEEMVNIAYDNSYRVLVGEITFDSLLNQVTEDESALMGFDPDYGPSLAELENMIVWYEEYEEYERCGRLHEILKSKYP